jgi:hypothetical protein
VAGLGDRLRRLEGARAERLPQPPEDLSRRARMKAYLDELAAAKREGREPSAEAKAISEAMERRRERES